MRVFWSTLVALGATAAAAASGTLSAAGSTVTSSVGPFTYAVGERFVVSWDDAALVLSVVDAASAQRAEAGPKVLWASSPGSFFVAVSGGHWDAKERDGSFTINTAVKDKTTLQTIDAVVYDNSTVLPRLVLSGQLQRGTAADDVIVDAAEASAAAAAGGGGNAIAYNFTFTCDPALPGHLHFEVLATMSSATEHGGSVGPVGSSSNNNDDDEDDFNQLFLRYTLDEDEAIYGFGHQYSFANLRGRTVPVISTEQGIGRGLEPITAILNTFGGGSGGNWHTTYSAVPQYVTSRMRSLFLESTEVAYFDSTAATVAEWTVVKPLVPAQRRDGDSRGGDASGAAGDGVVRAMRVAGRILAGDSPLDLIEQFTLWAGRMAPLPDWVLGGAVVGYEGGTAAVRAAWDRMRAAGVLLSGFWLQDWTGRRDDAGDERLWWNWELDEDHYPDWDALVLDLRASGARMLTYINPYLSNDVSAKKPNHRRDLWAEANASGFLVKDAAGRPYLQSSGITSAFSFSTIDLTQAAAREWTKEIVKCNMLRVGEGCGMANATTQQLTNVSAYGWMCDFGEYIPFDGVLGAMGEGDPAQTHNLYPQLWAQTVREAVDEAQQQQHQHLQQQQHQSQPHQPRRRSGTKGGSGGSGGGNEVVFFSRSSAARSPGFSPLFWMGDQLTTFDGFDGLLSAIVGMMSGGFSGHALSHSDIGGFTMVNDAIVIDNRTIGVKYARSKELLLRWCESSAVADAIFRTHPGLIPASSWQIDSDNDTLVKFGRYTRMHAALAPYRRALMEDAAAHGHPLTRHPFIHYPQDPFTAYPAGLAGRQFMLGANIMVAPVVVAGEEAVGVYFPVPTGGGAGDEAWVHWATGQRYFAGMFNASVPAPLGTPAIFGKDADGFLQSAAWRALTALA